MILSKPRKYEVFGGLSLSRGSVSEESCRYNFGKEFWSCLSGSKSVHVYP
jgi:hypothetical protein